MTNRTQNDTASASSADFFHRSNTDIILESISDGVFTVDADWHITSFNRAAEEITGVPRQEALGSRCCDVFRSSICEANCALAETLKTGAPVINRTVYIVNAEGERIPISVSTSMLRDTAGAVIGGVETFRDLSTVEELRKELTARYTVGDIIGRSHAMQRLFAVLPQLADSQATILIEGPSGTGKEVFARAIHQLSPRRDKAFVVVNSGALPDTLLESELFGYCAGAFTDARKDKPGRFQLADGGTIFLDEIGDISPAMQVRLLRVLQERVVEPLGGIDSVPVNVRVIAATNKPLAGLVAKGLFREDLYYRINIVRLELPPLRERREDLIPLIEHFIARFNHLQGHRVAGVSEEAMSILLAYDYPGNVRELENIIEHAFVLCRGGLIQPEHLPPHLLPVRALTEKVPGGMTLAALEAMHIVDAVRRHNGNRSAAARELGINPSTLHRKAKALGLPLPASDGRSKA